MQANIADSRPPIVDQITSIAKLGCAVHIVYDAMGSDAYQKLHGKANITTKRFNDNDKGRQSFHRIHRVTQYVRIGTAQ